MAKSKKKRLSEIRSKKQEKQFFTYAIGITIVVLILCYIFFIKS